MFAPAPRKRVPQAFLESDDRRITEERLRLRDVRLRILHVARPWVLVDRLQARADDAVHHGNELVERNARAARANPIGG